MVILYGNAIPPRLKSRGLLAYEDEIRRKSRILKEKLVNQIKRYNYAATFFVNDVYVEYPQTYIFTLIESYENKNKVLWNLSVCSNNKILFSIYLPDYGKK